ncbi:MAG: T9SS type A sorting domain-containing protein [Bacteroidetes bacterium]|nr:T9SS type A sorting domain-containing protein [Bacteroidota bacterium]
MKKHLLFLVFISIITIAQGQSTLTNGQVYDFDIGDTLQIRYNTPWNSQVPYKYETRVVLSKTITTNSDSIIYTIKSTFYTPPSTFSTSVITSTITNLSAIAPLYNNTSPCMGMLLDTMYFNSCGILVYKKYPGPSVSCTSQPFQQNTYLMKGLGGPYFDYFAVAGPPPENYYKIELIYYSKNIGTCGSLITTTKDVEKNDEFYIYPNPSTGRFTIKNASVIDQLIKLFDLTGKLLLEQTTKGEITIDATYLKAGIYNLQIKNLGAVLNKKLIITH